MGRPKSYQVEEVVARALPAFWKTGFEGTSLKDLEAATGLNKFGLYASFGSKRGLYLACLDSYVKHLLAPAFQAFDATSPDRIEAFLRTVVANLVQSGGLGCFLLNGGEEFRGTDAELNQRVQTTYAILTKTALAQWGDPARAQAFTALVRGLMASSRLGLSADELSAVVDGSRRLWT